MIFKFILIIIIFICSFFLALNFGSSGQLINLSSTNLDIILDFRLPRVISTLLIGALLSTAGCVYQSVFRNPLVSPDLLGASSGSAFGMVLLLLLGQSGFILSVGALVCGLIATIICVFCSFLISRFNILVLILTGILISSLLASLLNLMHYLMPNASSLFGVSYFLMGSLNGLDKSSLMLLVAFGAPAFVCLWCMSNRLDLLALPYDVMHSQGVSVRSLIIIALVLSTMCSAVTVSTAGIIGWVSLVIPNILRKIVGVRHFILLPFSAIVGASFLLIADTLSRSVSTVEIPIGVVTGIIGAPIFITIMAKKLKNR